MIIVEIDVAKDKRDFFIIVQKVKSLRMFLLLLTVKKALNISFKQSMPVQVRIAGRM